MLRIAFAILMQLTLMAGIAAAQDSQDAPAASAVQDRSSTGGAQTLEDILARQRGENIDDSFRRDDTGAGALGAEMTQQLGTLGGASDPELWRAFRYNAADLSVSAGGDVAAVLVQDGGMRWLSFREGPLRTYGGWLLLGTLAALTVFYLLRGRVRIDAPSTGRTVTRFQFIERFAHWMLAGSFVLLGLTGLASLFGRLFIAPYLGKDINAGLLIWSKWVHNNVSWAFMLALIMVFVMWVAHNIPNRTDLVWIRQMGGIVGKNHPPAKKFNFGQKLIFWSVIVLGASISASGLSLLFPFELPLFGKTFAILNDLGLPQLVGYGALPVELAPQEEMQLAQSWHAIISFVLMAIILAHIYIGSVGMEGAFDAMGNGEVDEAWAHQHHSIWLEEMREKGAVSQGGNDRGRAEGATPAE
ncbi:formate dehydrogenase subunit gamma [Phaeobacter sp. C3_T13_0]|uniref:formate dehydrogenase subunit gamma n=1 Tax=Phaeobacter cretensis TaxID=3342641 RepID=UPI0039BCCD16